MDLFDSKRQERLEAARKASVASKEAYMERFYSGGSCICVYYRAGVA